MAGSVNKVFLMGHLTRDIELKHTPSDQAVATIGLAVNRVYKTRDGENREETTFVDCEAWGRTAEIMSQYLCKGRPVFIEGRLSRFSKIAGEMVPHGTVEERVADVLGLKNSETPMVAVAGVSDEVRGEAIVLISAVEVTLDNLRQKLVEAGLPKLWVPRIIKQVDKIPCLGTGKLDLKALAQIASE